MQLTFSQRLVARSAPHTPTSQLARWWPIKRPEYKDLPPTLQLRLARMSQFDDDCRYKGFTWLNPVYAGGHWR
jgi:hypothetical protein